MSGTESERGGETGLYGLFNAKGKFRQYSGKISDPSDRRF